MYQNDFIPLSPPSAIHGMKNDVHQAKLIVLTQNNPSPPQFSPYIYTRYITTHHYQASSVRKLSALVRCSVYRSVAFW